MRELPIIFTAESVRSILEGRKTQTRRVLKPQPAYPDSWGDYTFKYVDGAIRCYVRNCMEADRILHPRYQVGDRLWVKETWGVASYYDGVPPAKISGAKGAYHASGGTEGVKARSPLFMPRWASRITLEVTEVRVQRVKEISEEDIASEGVDEALFQSLIVRGNRFKVLPEHWINGDDNESRSFCRSCAEKEIKRLKSIDPSRELLLNGGWDTDGDSPASCESCGVSLSNTFTDYCAGEELAILEDEFDYKSPADCYLAQEIIGSQLWSGGKLSSRIHRLAWSTLWDSINAKRGYPWKDNPWVWAYTFRRVGLGHVKAEAAE